MDRTVKDGLDMEDIAMERAREVQITWMRPYADASLNFASELKKIFNSLKSHGEFDMERLEAVGLTADSEEYVTKVKWVGLHEQETAKKPVSTFYAMRRST